MELGGYVETHGCYSVGMEYAVVGEVGDELCVAVAAASPGHVEDRWLLCMIKLEEEVSFENVSRICREFKESSLHRVSFVETIYIYVNRFTSC